MLTLESIADALRQQPRLVIADDFEIAVQRCRGQSVRYQNGEPCLQASNERFWVSLRVLHRKRGGIATVFNPAPEDLKNLVDQAFDAAQRSSLDPWFRFPIWKNLPEVKVPAPELRPERSHAALFGDAATLFDETYEALDTQTFLRRKTEKQTRRSSSQKLSARLAFFQADRRFAFSQDRLGPAADLPLWIARMKEAAENRGQQVRLSQLPKRWILTPAVASTWLRALAPWFYARTVQEGRSPLAGRESFSKAISLVDDGRHPYAAYGGEFDLEGSPLQKTPLIVRGERRDLLHDVYSATRDNRLSTANFHRDVADPHPSTRASALYVEAGQHDLGALVAEMGHGLILDHLDSWDVPAGTDKVQFTASGRLVEGGRVAGAVSSVPAECGLADLLDYTVAAGSDLEFFRGVGSPSLLVEVQ